ncbi:MAG TPA: hypothetical protein VFT74_11505, partial [Isosphaeraceae bacterium]|nr:hypothetical protein [Isosphaeraceae bacterium]
MSDEDATHAGPKPPEAWIDLRHRFETAWLRARRGGPEPVLDDFLQQVPEAHRTQVRAVLEPVDRAHRQSINHVDEATLTGDQTLDGGATLAG